MHNEDPNQQQVHEYDGIVELDNQLPRWWLWIFYLTTIFGIVYFIYYHVADKGLLPEEKYAQSLEKHQLTQVENNANKVTVERTAMTAPSTDEAVLSAGEKVYTTHCFACHTATGAGLVGPNLTDDSWIHGASFEETINVVTVGVPEKGMISWKPILKPEEIEAVCSYIYTLRGTNPANGKAPEGTQHIGSDSIDYENEKT